MKKVVLHGHCSDLTLTLSHLTLRRLHVAQVKFMVWSFSEGGVGLPLGAGAMGTGCTLGAVPGGGAVFILQTCGCYQTQDRRAFCALFRCPAYVALYPGREGQACAAESCSGNANAGPATDSYVPRPSTWKPGWRGVCSSCLRNASSAPLCAPDDVG